MSSQTWSPHHGIGKMNCVIKTAKIRTYGPGVVRGRILAHSNVELVLTSLVVSHDVDKIQTEHPIIFAFPLHVPSNTLCMRFNLESEASISSPNYETTTDLPLRYNGRFLCGNEVPTEDNQITCPPNRLTQEGEETVIIRPPNFWIAASWILVGRLANS